MWVTCTVCSLVPPQHATWNTGRAAEACDLQLPPRPRQVTRPSMKSIQGVWSLSVDSGRRSEPGSQPGGRRLPGAPAAAPIRDTRRSVDECERWRRSGASAWHKTWCMNGSVIMEGAVRIAAAASGEQQLLLSSRSQNSISGGISVYGTRSPQPDLPGVRGRVRGSVWSPHLLCLGATGTMWTLFKQSTKKEQKTSSLMKTAPFCICGMVNRSSRDKCKQTHSERLCNDHMEAPNHVIKLKIDRNNNVIRTRK